jgi:hypothetical protein
MPTEVVKVASVCPNFNKERKREEEKNRKKKERKIYLSYLLMGIS